MQFQFWTEGIIFIGIFLIIILIPCLGVSIMGYRMIQKLGYQPSQTPVIQMSIFLKLIVLEIISFILLIGFYRIFSVK